MDGIEDNLYIVRLTDESTSLLKRFKSKDTYLNQFLERRAKHHQSELLAITYLLFYKNEHEDELVGYYTLSCSSVTATEYVKSKFHHNKQYEDYPAILIGRLAISKEHEGRGFGSFLLDSIKYKMAFEPQSVAGRFLVLDSLEDSVDFYRKNRFDFWSKEDKNEATRLMYFDLLQTR